MAEKKKQGSVMVIGGGIAGVQSSLDLADAGYRVHLVENKPSIGGVMAQLDKTFPTNDCSMCILSPKLLSVARHPNIDLITYAEVDEITGDAGDFTVSVHHKARYVDAAKCTGCGECMRMCPVRNVIQIPEPVQDPVTDETKKVDGMIDAYGARKDSLISLLQDVQEEYNYLPEDALKRISSRLGLPYAEVYGTASFYKAFNLEPRGRHIIQICMGTACHVRGAGRLLEEIERRLGIKAGETTEDNLFTLETVNCLGACALGPIIAIDGDFHGQMTTDKVAPLLASYAEKEEAPAV